MCEAMYMSWSRMSFGVLLILASATGFAACGGGGDDVLSDEEYFARLTELDREVSREVGEQVYSVEEKSAREGADTLGRILDDAVGDYESLVPGAELEDEHDELVDAIDEWRDAIDTAGARAADDAGLTDLFRDQELVQADERLTAAFCSLQDVADEKGIEADVGCDDSSEPVDPSALTPEETTEVLIEDFSFQPAHIQVQAGATVTWTHGVDSEPHTVSADDGAFDSGNLDGEGATFKFTFQEAGEYSYFCRIHEVMLGLVTVSE
jgi:plastocyanin